MSERLDLAFDLVVVRCDHFVTNYW